MQEGKTKGRSSNSSVLLYIQKQAKRTDQNPYSEYNLLNDYHRVWTLFLLLIYCPSSM